MSHSKRNTSLAFFTSHERDQLRSQWGSQGARLNRDSFLPFGSCSLCLLPASDPVACNGGAAPPNAASASSGIGTGASKSVTRPSKRRPHCHIFCRECAMSNLLQQRKEFKRLGKENATRKVEEDAQDAKDDVEAQQRAVDDFERVQQGLDVKLGIDGKMKRTIVGRREGKVIVEETSNDEAEGKENGGSEANPTKKRKLEVEVDEAELVRISQNERAKARKTLNDEKAEAAKSTLPSFWVPSLTPGQHQQLRTTSNDETTHAEKLQPICPGSSREASHSLSLKLLVDVKFSEEKQASSKSAGGDAAVSREGKMRICPACSRPLTNASKAVLAKPCGHVLCATCVDKFVADGADEGDEVTVEPAAKTVRCFVCSEDLGAAVAKKTKHKHEKEKEKDKEKIRQGLVDICSEGTGFAGGGTNVVKRHGVAFQC